MQLEDIKTAAVVGSGTMGAGFGLCLARAGLTVRLYDVSPEQLDRALERIRASLGLLVAEGLADEAEARAVQARLSTSLDLAQALAGVDFVLEAAPEKLALKKDLFAKFEELCPAGAILATNTSAIPITQIAAGLENPGRVAGMHWFNPPDFVPLVEVVRGEKSAEETVRLIYGLAEKMGKAPIIVEKDVPGFVGNRIQLAAVREAFHIVSQGWASPEDVDKAMRGGPGFRWAWQGPLETADLGGLDVFLTVGDYLYPHLCVDPKSAPILAEKVAAGELGLKTGRGFYDYQAGAGEEIARRRDRYFLLQEALQAKVRRGD